MTTDEILSLEINPFKIHTSRWSIWRLCKEHEQNIKKYHETIKSKEADIQDAKNKIKEQEELVSDYKETLSKLIKDVS